MLVFPWLSWSFGLLVASHDLLVDPFPPSLGLLVTLLIPAFLTASYGLLVAHTPGFLSPVS